MDNEVLRYDHPDGRQSLILDDDGKTGYAYLLDQAGSIVADCWLYNRGAAPVDNEWHTPDNMPFANSTSFVKLDYANGFGPIDSESDVDVVWSANGADIFLQGQLFARLVAGAKPGWSRLAARDGPLALRLDA